MHHVQTIECKNCPVAARVKTKVAPSEARREERLAVRRYLEAIESAPRGGRHPRSAGSIHEALAAVDARLATAGKLTELQLVQQRINLEAELARAERAPDLRALEEAFVRSAKAYGDRRGISYRAWRHVGVRPDTLAAAGITPV
jgi:hypothetical protein